MASYTMAHAAGIAALAAINSNPQTLIDWVETQTLDLELSSILAQMTNSRGLYLIQDRLDRIHDGLDEIEAEILGAKEALQQLQAEETRVIIDTQEFDGSKQTDSHTEIVSGVP